MCVQLDLISTLHHLVKSLPLEFATDRTLMNLSDLRQIGKLFRPQNMKAPGAVAASKKKISQPVMLLLFGMLEKAGLGVLTTYKRNTLFKKTPLKTLGSVTATNMLMRFELGIQDFYSASGVDTQLAAEAACREWGGAGGEWGGAGGGGVGPEAEAPPGGEAADAAVEGDLLGRGARRSRSVSRSPMQTLPAGGDGSVNTPSKQKGKCLRGDFEGVA